MNREFSYNLETKTMFWYEAVKMFSSDVKLVILIKMSAGIDSLLEPAWNDQFQRIHWLHFYAPESCGLLATKEA